MLWTPGAQLIHAKAWYYNSHPTSTAMGRVPHSQEGLTQPQKSIWLSYHWKDPCCCPPHPWASSTSSFTPDNPQTWWQRFQCPPISRYPWQPFSSPGRTQISWTESLSSAPASIMHGKWTDKRLPQLPQIRMCISASLCSLLSSHHWQSHPQAPSHSWCCSLNKDTVHPRSSRTLPKLVLGSWALQITDKHRGSGYAKAFVVLPSETRQPRNK